MEQATFSDTDIAGWQNAVSVKAESGLKSQSRYEILILEKSKDFSRILILGRSRERWVRVN